MGASRLADASFLSTPSARRATCCPIVFPSMIKISIHALREEGDGRSSPTESTGSNFYPRPPRGGRRFKVAPGVRVNLFLSTPSARRATLTTLPVCVR